MENLIIKYLNNSISEAELVELREWLKDSKNQTKFKNFVKLQHNLNNIYQTSSKEAYQTFNKRLKAKERKSKLPFYLKIAAIFIIGLGALGFSYYILFQSPQFSDKENWVKVELSNGNMQFIAPNQSAFSNTENHFTGSQESLVYSDSTTDDEEEEEVKFNALSVPKGKTFVIVLSDGTKITLNAGSSLQYPTKFNKATTEREVYLNGEAFFEVEYENKTPFIVHTEELNIRVLGTKFNLSAYKEDKSAYAVLVDGKIQAENPNDKTKLEVSPGCKVYYKDGTLKTKKVSLEKHTAWINGELLFIDDSFEVIKNKLERRYDIGISNTFEALNDIVITANFSSETIEQVLETFKAYKDFDYVQKDNQIIISEPTKNTL